MLELKFLPPRSIRPGFFPSSREAERLKRSATLVDGKQLVAVCRMASTTFRFLDFNFVTRDRQKAPEIAPLFNAFQRAGPRPENSFLYLLGHTDLAFDTSVIRPLAPTAQPALEAMEADL